MYQFKSENKKQTWVDFNEKPLVRYTYIWIVSHKPPLKNLSPVWTLWIYVKCFFFCIFAPLVVHFLFLLYYQTTNRPWPFCCAAFSKIFTSIHFFSLEIEAFWISSKLFHWDKLQFSKVLNCFVFENYPILPSCLIVFRPYLCKQNNCHV